MGRAWLVARHEWLEHRRQPGMLLAMAAVQLSICGTVLFGMGIMSLIHGTPAQEALLKENLAFAGMPLEDPVGWSVDLMLSTFNFLTLSQLLGMTAVMAGQAIVHERQCGTLPFLMVAPIGRFELMLGKVLGALGSPFLLTLCIGGSTALLLSATELSALQPWRLPPSPGWMVAFFLGAPSWAATLAGMGAAISARARDVRGAQQGVWLLVFFATLIVGFLLGGGLQEDATFQLVMAGLGALGALSSVALAAVSLRHDLER